MNIMDNCTSSSTKKDVKYLKCVDDNSPGRATLKNGNISLRVTTEHAQHDAVTEEISENRLVWKRAAQEDSHTLRQIFDDTRDNVV